MKATGMNQQSMTMESKSGHYTSPKGSAPLQTSLLKTNVMARFMASQPWKR